MLVRIVLDTCTVRNHLHGTGEHLDFGAIGESTEQLRFSLAGGTWVELLEQLTEGRLTWADWSSNIGGIDRLLDERWPLLPTGRQLSALAGTQTDIEINVEEEQRHLQACWRLLNAAESMSDLTDRDIRFQGTDGRDYSIRLDTTNLTSVATGQRSSWIDHVARMQFLLPQLGLRSADEASILALMHSESDVQPGDPPDFHERMDGIFRMIARLVSSALDPSSPYNPTSERRRGDAFDLSLLFYLPLPSVICTADRRFVNRLRATGSAHARQVVTVSEFNQIVRRNETWTLVRHFRTPDEQHRRWQEAAHSHWVERGRPMFADPETDWFATEPLA